ncbi:MAG: hypothetical protein Q9226_002291 [Calogaya cf. arnoldii]
MKKSKVVYRRQSALAIVKNTALDCNLAGCTDDGKLPDATVPIVENNPDGVTYTAILPDLEETSIRGFSSAFSRPDGTGVDFTVDLSGLPDMEQGPFTYHIHDKPVPEGSGIPNYTATGAHLDPYERGPIPPCDAKHPETYEVGDLAGKHGKITEQKFRASFNDNFLSTAEGPDSFFGKRSVVMHAKDSKRLTCANFALAPPPS